MRCLLSFYSIGQLIAFISATPITGHNISPANPREFPFIASLGVKYPTDRWEDRHHICGGSLISKKHVLTAAHCIEAYLELEVDVIVGEVDLTTPHLRYDVDSWITYDDWAPKRNKTIAFDTNDVAIVKLMKTVCRIGVEPVKFTNLNAEQLGKTRAVIAGWGITNEGRDADVLQKAIVKIMSSKRCEINTNLIANVPLLIPKNYLCSSAHPHTLTDCGDSGGPVLNENNVLLGIIRGTCPKIISVNFPLEYVNLFEVNVHIAISYYIDFIEDVAEIRVRPAS